MLRLILKKAFLKKYIQGKMKQKVRLLSLPIAIMLVLFSGLNIAYGKEKNEGAIKFQETSYNFGNIPEDGGPVSHDFVFINEGPGNLVIYDARAQCGCTKPTVPEKAIAAGKTDKIKVTFLPKGRVGGFTKIVTVKCSGHPGKVTLKITGTVVPKQ